MVKLADTEDLKSFALLGMGVQVPLRAPSHSLASWQPSGSWKLRDCKWVASSGVIPNVSPVASMCRERVLDVERETTVALGLCSWPFAAASQSGAAGRAVAISGQSQALTGGLTRGEERLSHQHFCDVGGHLWTCEGMAARPEGGSPKPVPCRCFVHEVPIEQGDHTGCPIELLACPLHQPAFEVGVTEEDVRSRVPANFFLEPGLPSRKAVGFCLWCGCDFQSVEEMLQHHAGDLKGCPAFAEGLDPGDGCC